MYIMTKKVSKKKVVKHTNVNTNKNSIKININSPAPKRKYVRKSPTQPKQTNHYITVNNSGPAPYNVPLQASPLLQPQVFHDENAAPIQAPIRAQAPAHVEEPIHIPINTFTHEPVDIPINVPIQATEQNQNRRTRLLPIKPRKNRASSSTLNTFNTLFYNSDSESAVPMNKRKNTSASVIAHQRPNSESETYNPFSFVPRIPVHTMVDSNLLYGARAIHPKKILQITNAETDNENAIIRVINPEPSGRVETANAVVNKLKRIKKSLEQVEAEKINKEKNRLKREAAVAEKQLNLINDAGIIKANAGKDGILIKDLPENQRKIIKNANRTSSKVSLKGTNLVDTYNKGKDILNKSHIYMGSQESPEYIMAESSRSR